MAFGKWSRSVSFYWFEHGLDIYFAMFKHLVFLFVIKFEAISEKILNVLFLCWVLEFWRLLFTNYFAKSRKIVWRTIFKILKRWWKFRFYFLGYMTTTLFHIIVLSFFLFFWKSEILHSSYILFSKASVMVRSQ